MGGLMAGRPMGGLILIGSMFHILMIHMQKRSFIPELQRAYFLKDSVRSHFTLEKYTIPTIHTLLLYITQSHISTAFLLIFLKNYYGERKGGVDFKKVFGYTGWDIYRFDG